ncbi:protein bric-a-brac 1 isoform X2 [Cephus cinctus]|nr:protein bric-a-brac 1 isoform X2 [Cephus cinctus]XP_015590047.1 protein bric-a-brac 1 isoform X2 [Cephus cinctus]XP_015590048.1 protein bric-a-brac 1 isoform X2 [Cephus cinctus]XP_015590049.1 protein bric-a-brac 1 isoform X2 [Cephus cinctus]XP_024938140.1 protein bric-a-brac 1 isoform X2 [Cephus cinctus]XP_024938141.1 protein bric-a-brac 1 isoform X2 [Cephus cinctus]
MGSEHYCLRWNNHQSNLLGVFSQLLESESLVDVTLACTEGPSIRAHKVVLSACSSYFQALFLDHPNRHPIVILKDVRFSELRTLVDFMYKGEVNVEYCQLSALLKTAESLKVKGLADMTNINAAAASREEQHLATEGQRDREHRERDRDRDRDKERDREPVKECEQPQQPPQQPPSESVEALDMTECPPSPTGPGSPCPGPLALDRPRRDSEDAASLEETRGSLSPISVHSGPSDMSLSNNTGAPGVLPLNLPQSRLPSPHSTEPLAGPSGLPPVQQVPLSLKKEVDWERSTEERSASSEISTDYRLPPDPVTLALGLEVGGWGALVERSGTHGGSSLLGHGGFAGLAGLARRCGVCLATFPSAWLLERHALLQHAGQPSDDKPFTCEQCGQRYRYRSAYVKHREQNHRARLPADKLFTCDVCGMQFRYLKSFKKHRLNHALERLQRGPEHQAGPAERSDQVSSTGEPSQMETGSDTNPGDGEERVQEITENTRDETVSETTSVQDNPEAAELQVGSGVVGTGETSEIGDVDDGNVDDERNEPTDAILGLIRGHDPDRRERRFACPFCGKCVRSKENLKLHVRKHTGERPFVCLFCGRAFGGKSDLTRHLRIHTGERPYHCEMCGKCFARADYLSKHLTTHIHQR